MSGRCRRSLSSGLQVQAAFKIACRGKHYRVGFEPDSTIASAPGENWAWDEWILTRTGIDGVRNGFVFETAGAYEVKVVARLDRTSTIVSDGAIPTSAKSRSLNRQRTSDARS